MTASENTPSPALLQHIATSDAATEAGQATTLYADTYGPITKAACEAAKDHQDDLKQQGWPPASA